MQKKLSLGMLVLILAVIAGCSQEDDIPIEPLPSTKRLIVSAEDIPQVTGTLLQKMGARDALSRFSVNNGEASTPFTIDWDRIKQLVDSTGRETYTFGLTVDDGDPATFYNLVLRYNQFKEAHQPFILKYTMVEDYLPEYLARGTLEGFRGTVRKIIINEFPSSRQRSSSNDGGEGSAHDVMDGQTCPGERAVGNPSGSRLPGSSGGGSGSPGSGTGSPGPGVTEVFECTYFVQETDWYQCLDANCNEMEFDYTSYEFTTECSWRSIPMSSADTDDACQPEEGDIPIIDPLEARGAMEQLIESITDPEEKKDIQLKYLKQFGGDEGKAIAEMIEELLQTPGLTVGDAYEIYKLVDKFYSNLQGQYIMAIFSVENVSTILSFGLGGNFTTATRNSMYKAVARYASTSGKGYSTMAAFKAAHGAAGPGKAWHHIVSQRSSNLAKFGAEKIHNTTNLVKLPHGSGTWHQRITNFYNSIPDVNMVNTRGLRFGEWVAQKSFKEQYEWGIRIMNLMK